jgi:hypothetical protein
MPYFEPDQKINNQNKPWQNNTEYTGQSNWQKPNQGSSSYQKPANTFNNFRPKSPAEQEDPYLYRPYAATGNKDMPESMKPCIQRIGKNLEKSGYILRTGGMDGLEDVIEKSVSKLELHLPWKDFDKKQSKLTFTSEFVKGVAKMFHPTFDSLKPVIQTFLAKNVRLLLGKEGKSPALFLIVWTDDGAELSREVTFKTGNSGHAINIANAMRIPVFNLTRPDAERRLYEYADVSLSPAETTNTDLI